MVWCNVMWYGVMWCDMVWCDVIWCGVMWYTSQRQRIGAQSGNLFRDVIPIDELHPEDVVRCRRCRIETRHADGRLKSVHLDEADDGDVSLKAGTLARRRLSLHFPGIKEKYLNRKFLNGRYYQALFKKLAIPGLFFVTFVLPIPLRYSGF